MSGDRLEGVQFQRLVESLGVGVVVLGPRGEVVFANGAVLELLGLGEGELLGRGLFAATARVLREDGTPLPPAEHPVARALASGRSVRGVVLGLDRRPGDRALILVGADPELGADGTARRVVVTLCDVTAVKRAPHTAPLVLVVEDNTVSQRAVVVMLENMGYRTEAATNGIEAVEACSRTVYDAILMDCQMPEMDGFRATAWIRQREGPGRRTPVIALTASVTPGDREKCLSAGMDDYLGKPVGLGALDAALRKWILRTGSPAQPPAPGAGGLSSLPADHPLRVLEAQGRGAIAAEIIDLFLQTTPVRLEGLRSVHGLGDVAELLSLTHSLKGAALQLAARGMAELCVQIQAAARAGDLGEAGRLLDALETEYQTASAPLEAEWRRLTRTGDASH